MVSIGHFQKLHQTLYYMSSEKKTKNETFPIRGISIFRQDLMNEYHCICPMLNILPRRLAGSQIKKNN